MLGKMTSKNQITIPKKIVDQLPDTSHFDIGLKDGVVFEHADLVLVRHTNGALVVQDTESWVVVTLVSPVVFEGDEEFGGTSCEE